MTLRFVDTTELAHQQSGPQWGAESDDLNATVLSWEEGRGVAWSVNNELDVVMVVLDGEGEARIEDEVVQLKAGVALLIPKGAQRSVIASSQWLTYMNVHRRRPGLMPMLHQTEPGA
jgi:mannose-6-phosphate isomerase-like protein (cupin superfamily)